MVYTLVTPPAPNMPLTMEEVKQYLRVEGLEDEEYLSWRMHAVREYVEEIGNRQLLTATWALRLDCFPHCSSVIEITKCPVQSVSSITYVDPAGVTQTWAANQYQVDRYSEPARIFPAYGVSWPDVYEQFNAVTVTFVAGYGAATAVPQSIKDLMLLLIAHRFENREPVNIGAVASELPYAVTALLWQTRNYRMV